LIRVYHKVTTMLMTCQQYFPDQEVIILVGHVRFYKYLRLEQIKCAEYREIASEYEGSPHLKNCTQVTRDILLDNA